MRRHRIAAIAVGALIFCTPTTLPAGVSQCDPYEGLYSRLIRHEGERACVYVDTFGNPTIGIGHLLKRPVEKKLCWKEHMVLSVFHRDVHAATHNAQRVVPRWHLIDSLRREVLAELAFQIGASGLSRFKRMLNAVHEDDYDLAAKELLRSRLARQTPTRTNELACLMRLRLR